MICGRFPSRCLAEIMIASTLCLLVVAVYGPVVHFGFVNYDDPLYVTDNARVRSGWLVDGVRWAFRDFGSSNWHSLTWLSHMTDWALFRDNAGGHHGTNVVLHAMNAIPLIVLSAASIAVTLLAAERGGALKTLDHFSLTVRLGNALYAYAAYLGKIFLPLDPAVFYPHPGSLSLWQTAGAGLLIAAVTALVLRWYRERPYLPVG